MSHKADYKWRHGSLSLSLSGCLIFKLYRRAAAERALNKNHKAKPTAHTHTHTLWQLLLFWLRVHNMSKIPRGGNVTWDNNRRRNRETRLSAGRWVLFFNFLKHFSKSSFTTHKREEKNKSKSKKKKHFLIWIRALESTRFWRVWRNLKSTTRMTWKTNEKKDLTEEEEEVKGLLCLRHENTHTQQCPHRILRVVRSAVGYILNGK
jgi:hypothetical protein